MTAEIIAVGTEILLGDIVNTNAQYISRKLSELGISIYYQTVVGDNEGRLTDSIKTALLRSDIVILSGGLGPTDDDITKEVCAKVMGNTLVLHQESLDRMTEYFKIQKNEMPKVNIKQAYMPKEGTILPNDFGTAPGCIMTSKGKTAILLPGPPREIVPMFDNYVYPYLAKHADCIILSRTLRIFGMGESSVQEAVADLIKYSENPTVAPYAKDGEVTLRMTARCQTRSDAENKISQVEAQIRDVLGDKVYGIDDNTLEKTVTLLLAKQGKTVATAESCTGGLLSSAITSVPGSSAVFTHGFITYSNEAKTQLLGVNKDILDAHGAVSPETAVAMAKGALAVSGADMAVSVTGIAGPDGGTAEKPVGLVYIGYADKNTTEHYTLRIKGDRAQVRNRTFMHALDVIRRHLL